MKGQKLNYSWRFVSLCVVLPTVLSYEATACFGLFLRLSCDSGSVISVVWDATFFGQSSCGVHGCCPGPDDCTVLVTEFEHAGKNHWRELNGCNGDVACTVQAVHASTCKPTNYETVTYNCVTPGASTTPDQSGTVTSSYLTSTGIGSVPTSDGAVYSSTSERASTPDESFTTSSLGPQSSTGGGSSSEGPVVTSTPWATTTRPTDEGTRSPERENGSNMLGVMIAVVVAVVVLIIVVLAVSVFIYCRRRRKAAANDKEAPFKDEIIKRPDRTYSTPGKQPLRDENGYDALGSSFPAAVSADTPPKPATFGPVNGDYYSQPQKIRPTETSAKPLGSSLYSQPVDAKLADENPEEHYSYAYGQFRDQNQVSPAGGDRAAEGKGSVIYADIMHQQNEEYLEEDDTILTENSLYRATVDALPGQRAEAAGNHGDDDDDMMITDNDVYEMNQGDSTHQQQDQAEDADDDDDDMILTDNDLYSAT